MFRRRLLAYAALASLFLALLLPLIHASPAAAHLRGQPSFLKIDNVFVDYYTVKDPSLNPGSVPQSMDMNYHLPGETIRLEVDRKLFGVSYKGVDRMKFSWDFGDGHKSSGLSVQHTYTTPGTYLLRITASAPGQQAQAVEATSMQIFPDEGFTMPHVYVVADGTKNLNAASRNTIRGGQEVRFEAVLDPDITGGPAAGNVEYVWDFGDKTTARGQSVSHIYNKGFREGFPWVKVIYAGNFYVANQAWLADPTQRDFGGSGLNAAGVPIESADRADSSAGNRSDPPGFYASIKHAMQTKLNLAFAGGTIQYPLVLLILGFAVIAGALHSLTPGHGKTILAALLIGRDSSRYRDLLILTSAITISHTLVIYLIGFVFLGLSRSRSVNSLLPIFEAVSAGLVISLAAYLIYTGIRRLRAQRAHAQAHRHGDAHDHTHGNTHEHSHGHSHAHGHSHELPATSGRASTWSLIVAGTGGGIVPCLDALSLMLLAAGLGHVGFGIILVVFFSLGLALTITILGLLLLTGKKRLLPKNGTEQKIAIYAPLISGSLIFVLAVLTLL